MYTYTIYIYEEKNHQQNKLYLEVIKKHDFFLQEKEFRMQMHAPTNAEKIMRFSTNTPTTTRHHTPSFVINNLVEKGQFAICDMEFISRLLKY